MRAYAAIVLLLAGIFLVPAGAQHSADRVLSTAELYGTFGGWPTHYCCKDFDQCTVTPSSCPTTTSYMVCNAAEFKESYTVNIQDCLRPVGGETCSPSMLKNDCAYRTTCVFDFDTNTCGLPGSGTTTQAPDTCNDSAGCP